MLKWHEARFEERPGTLRLDCQHCARPMWFPPSKHGKYKTCGAECSRAIRDSVKQARTKNCETCGTSFLPRPRQLALGQGRFCSQKCNTVSHESMNTQEAQIRARAGWRKRWLESPFSPTGEDNPRWRGGKQAAKLRRYAAVAKYKRDNPGRVRVWASNRRARAGGPAPGWAATFLMKAQHGCCAACSTQLDDSYHLDHIQPIARGGTSEITNLQLLCKKCNLHKAAKDPIDFMQSIGKLL